MSQGRNSRSPALRDATLSLGLAVVYFVAAKLGLTMAFVAEQVTPVWPPTGIALAGVLTLGYRVWPGISLGAFLANATANEPIATAAGIAIGNTLEALVGAWLLHQVVGFRTSLDRLRDVIGLVALAAGASTTISATIGTVSLAAGGMQPWPAFGSIWSVWWLGDALGALIMAPILLTWAAWMRQPSGRRQGEAIALVASLVAACVAVFVGPLESIPSRHPFEYVVFPFVIWAALRFGQPGTTTVTLIASAVAIWGTVHDSGPFATGDAQNSLILLDLFMAVVAVSGLLLAAALSERQRAVEAARLNEERLRFALSEASMGTWDYDILTGEVTWSENLEAIHGLSAGRFGGTFAAYLDEVHPDDRDRVMQAIRHSIEAGVAHDIEYRIVSPDGDVRWFHGHGQVIRDRAGRAVRMTGVCTDTTGRKRAEEALQESEERFKGIIQSAMDAVITIDQDERIILFNAAAERMFRSTSSEVIGTSLERLIPVSAREVHHRHIRQFGETGVTSRTMGAQRTLSALRADGEEFPMEATISQTRVAGQKLYTVIIRDASERVRAEEEREQLLAREHAARVEAEAANRTKDEFLATVSHELRSPLNAIGGWAQLLRMEGTDAAAAQHAVKAIERNVTAQAQLIGDLLDVSRIITGHLRLDWQSVDLRQLIGAALDVVRPAAEAKAIRLEATLDPAAGATWGDPNRLQQVVWNLLSNAVKFTPSGGRVEVFLTGTDRQAQIRVRDTGQGIAPEFLPAVFDRFRQADARTSRTHGGLGLGLAIVRHLTELHGGTARAESPGVGLGATFTVTLPIPAGRPPVRKPEAQVPAAETDVVSAEISEVAGLRVLVVDDDADSRTMLAMLLGKCGVRVTVAGSAAEALAVLERENPDALVSDIGMAAEDGYELIQKLRTRPAARGGQIPAVALTGYAREQDAERARAAGYQSHLSKPVRLADLTATLASLVGRSRKA